MQRALCRGLVCICLVSHMEGAPHGHTIGAADFDEVALGDEQRCRVVEDLGSHPRDPTERRPAFHKRLEMAKRIGIDMRARAFLSERPRRDASPGALILVQALGVRRSLLRDPRSGRAPFFFSRSRSTPTANTEDPCRSVGTDRRVSPRPFRRYPLIRSSPRRSPSACAEKLSKIDPRSGRSRRSRATLGWRP